MKFIVIAVLAAATSAINLGEYSIQLGYYSHKYLEYGNNLYF